MTQTASIDLGALATTRREAPPARKSQGDFTQTMREVQDREPQDAPKADRPEKIDRPQNKADAHDGDRQADAAKDADRPDKPENTPAEKPKADSSDKSDQTEAPKAKDTDQAKAEDADAAKDAAKADAQTTEEAQAALALALATGVQLVEKAQAATVEAETKTDVATPTQAATEVKPAETKAADVKLVQAQPTGATAEDAQKLAALLAKQVADAKAAPKDAKAQATPADAAKATEAAKAPDALTQAVQGLGKVTVKATTEPAPKPDAPNVKTANEVTNLTVQLIDAPKEAPTATGSTTQATLLDDAIDIEMTSQTVKLTDTDTDALTTDADKPDGVSLLNGDRTVGGADAKATALKAPASTQTPKPDDVMPQILKHADQLRAAQQNSVKLQLYPEHLGKMEIKVTSHHGVISAQLTADNHQVKSMLETQVAHLQHTFAEMGFKVDKVEVTLASANLNFDASGSMAQGQDQGAFQQGRPGGSQTGFTGLGYEQWLGEEPAEERYADLSGTTAINYVA